MKRCGTCIYWGDHRGVSIETYAQCLHPLIEVLRAVANAKHIPAALSELEVTTMFKDGGKNCAAYEVHP